MNAPRRRGDPAGAAESVYRLSTVSANQLNLARGRIVSERTTDPITASGIVMVSPSLLRYSNAEAAKQAIGTITLTPNEPNKAFGQPSARAC
jgi:hypothetical protein